MPGAIEIDLPENFTIANIHPIHEKFEAVVDDQGHDHITIRAAQVSRADTAGAQLLYAFVQAAKDRQIKLTWQEPSAKLKEVLQTLGMTEAVGLQ